MQPMRLAQRRPNRGTSTGAPAQHRASPAKLARTSAGHSEPPGPSLLPIQAPAAAPSPHAVQAHDGTARHRASCADTTWVRISLLRTSSIRDKAAGQSGVEGTKPKYEALQLLSPELHGKALSAGGAYLACHSWVQTTDWGHGASRGQNSIGSLRVTFGPKQQAWTAGAQALSLGRQRAMATAASPASVQLGANCMPGTVGNASKHPEYVELPDVSKWG